jgi:hypothetical protein
MKKLFTLLLLNISLISLGQSSTVVISQVYGGGGSATGYYNADYVELHNISNTVQNISGFKLMYGSSGGNLGSSGTAVFTFPANTTIPVGGYVLIANSPGTGINALPVTRDFTFTLAMAGANGKVVFGNASLTASVTYATQLSSGNVIDFVGYGTANESETSPVAALSVTTGAVRNTNGCTETNNNSTDFTVTTNPVPRNSGGTAITCSGPVATISASPTSISVSSSVGSASSSQSFNVTASTLTPAAGNLTITPSSGLEFSFDNSTFFTTAETLAYTGSAVTSTPIYVRIAATAPQGAVSGSITISGGAATNAVVTVTGGVFQNYYNKPVGDLTATSSWGTNADGSGTLPADFATAYQVFNMVQNNSLGAPWDISGTSSKLIIGDGSAAITLSTTLTDTLKATVITDVLDNAVLNISNKIPPALGSLTSASKIIFSYNATATTDTIKIPALNYGFLTLQNGLKYFKSGITTVNADLVFDNVVNANGAASPFSTISLKGNLSMIGTSNFEDSTTGSGNRLTLSMAGTGTQNIFTNGNELSIFRLIRDTAIGTTNVNIDLGTNSKITLGNNTSGGLILLQKAAGTPTTTTLNLSGTTQMALVKNGVVTDATNNRVGNINATGGTIILNKTIANTATQGVLRFAANSVLDALTVNITTPAKDSIIINDDLSINNALTLTDGKIIMATGKILKMNASSAITGGAVGSFVEGILSNTAASGNINFPVGKGTKYAPVTVGILTGSNRYDVLYANSGYGTYTIGTSTLATYPNYNVSQKEYWNITPAATATADVSLFYTDNKTINANPTSLRGAHFNATNNSWDDKGNANTGSNTLINGQVTMLGVDDFSPFTFAADIAGVLPIKLTNFIAIKDGKIVKIQFTTGQEINTKWHIVEQSTDTKNWKTAATLTAAGNATVENMYDAFDLLPAKRTNYYRIKTIDIDGRANYSMIKSVLFSFSFEIAVSPNPVSNILTVLIAKPNSNGALISIVNTVGAKVYEQSTKDASIKINIENLAKGTYFVKALQGENVSVKKIIVQ